MPEDIQQSSARLILNSVHVPKSLRRTLYHTRRRAKKSAAALARRMTLVLRPELYLGRVASLSKDREAIEGLLAYRPVVPARQVTLEDPRLCAFLHRQNAVPADGCSYTTPEVFYAVLEHARFDPRSGVVAAQDNTLLLDSAMDMRRLKRTPTYGSPVPEHFRRLGGTYSSIHGMWPDNYFHWMIECLFRLYTLKVYGEPVKLLTPRALSPMQQETLMACKPANVEIVYLDDDHTWLQAERYVLPSYLSRKHFAHLPRPYVDYFRQCMFAAFGVPLEREPDLNIYISRAGARIRRLKNEEALLKLLASYDFIPYRLEELSLTDQINLFRRARMVVAPHGAGLFNIVFSDALHLLEITSRVITPTFFFLAMSLGHDYQYLYPCEAAAPDEMPDITQSRRYSQERNSDISVDLEQVAPLLEAMMQTPHT